MNRKGQTLVAFVIIVPIFILLLAFVVDTGFILKEATKLNSTTKTVLRTTYQERMEDNYNERVKTLYIKNDIPIEELNIEIKENKIKLSNHYYIESIFGKIMGLKEYEIKITMEAQEIDGKIVITKE